MVSLIKNNKGAITLIIIALLNIFIFLKLDYQCPWREQFHIYCAGCGGTRMFYSLLKLEFYQAFRYNPLLFLFLVCSIIYIIYSLYCNLFKKIARK